MTEIALHKKLHIDLPEEIDLTFQLVPEYCENEEVICGWSGDELEYLVTADDQLGGMRHDDYWTGMLNSLKESSDDGCLRIITSGDYTNQKGNSVSYKVFQTTVDGDKNNHMLHLLVGEHIAYWIITVFVNITDIFRVNNNVKEIVRSARIEE